ncbi:membrane protein insertion efficiency factor YidD [Marinomonas ostreistagni]|uniref:membrane protein insertion efficiency factor YidD n=1 Tax=Marinomonas ostreistagni TaxID=359209 RepID=UPI0019524849|nr:membrane protein insertion efficiency factor YidD [Marinomonas ostreistagni]MBM6550912.1 membrane protein insertion efficiency factor YidD [Marinomonas ostreistagni]
MNLGQRALLALIRRYQQGGGGSRRFGVSCNFSPTCSEYAAQAIQTYGVIKGCWLAWRRLRRCNVPDQVERIDDPLP